MTFVQRLAAVIERSGPLCVGIDPHAALLRDWGLPDDASGLREFGLRVVEAASGVVGILKPQVAFFERHGATGFAALEELLAAARAAGLLAIADAKRGDIRSTAQGYADAWLRPGAPLEADALTASPYLGVGALDPLFAAAERAAKGVFVLAATSNPEAAPVQGATAVGGGSVARAVVEELSTRRSGAAGVVLGATVRLADHGIDAEALGELPILAPGFGAQGMRLNAVPELFGAAAARVIPSVSRSVLGAGPDGLASALAAARAEVAAWQS